MSSTHSTPRSPTTRSEWSCGAMRLHVSRTTTPLSKVMQATAKSADLTGSAVSRPLSGKTQVEKPLTEVAAPNMAGSQDTT